MHVMLNFRIWFRLLVNVSDKLKQIQLMHFRVSVRIQPIYASEKSFNYVGNIKKTPPF